METKQCSKCGEIKLLVEFHKDKNNKTGHKNICRLCVTTYDKEYRKTNPGRQREWYKANAERLKAKDRERYKNNPEGRKAYAIKNADRLILNGIRKRAGDKNIPFDLTLEDIQGITHCPVFGIELKRSQGKGYGHQPNSPSVDRIVPELGYVKGNIQIMSMKANTMKQDATPEELLMFADWIYKTYQK